MNRTALLTCVAAISLLLTAFMLSTDAVRAKPQSTLAAEQIFEQMLIQAREGARASTNGGETIVLQIGTRGLEGWIYDGRPAPNETMPAAPIAGPFAFPANVTVSATGVAKSPPVAIIIASDGSADVAAWAMGQGVIENEPVCAGSGTQTLVFTLGSATTSDTLTCQTSLAQ